MKRFKQFFIDNKIILIVLFCFCILVYGYAGLNTIINLDGIDDFMIKDKVSNYELYLSVGRWGWSIIGLFFDYYPSSFLCLILNSVVFSVSGVYLGKLFKLKSKLYTILISMLMIAFPVNIIAYTYLPWQYSIGIGYFVSIYSVYRLCTYKNYKDGIIVSLLIAFSMSVYQTFLSLIVVLCVVSLIMYLIENKNIKKFYKKILTYIMWGVTGIIIYYIIVKISTFIFGVEMNTYQGANSMFNINYIDIIYRFKDTLISCFKFNFGGFYSPVVNGLLLTLIIVGFILNFFKINVKKAVRYCILIYIMIISPKILNFIKPNVIYHLITFLPYSMFYIGGLIFTIKGIDVIKNKKIRKIFNIACIIILSISCFSLMVNANKAFIMSRQATDAAFSYLNRLEARIEMIEGYEDLPNPKKYYLYRRCEGCSLSKFPFSDYAYIKEQGVTWTFLEINSDIIPAFNLMGENVVRADIDYVEYYEIRELVRNRKEYPDESSIFIYKDIVVIIMEI